MTRPHTPSERSENPPQTVHAVPTTPAPRVGDCPSCGGYGDHGYDDEGKQYTCYSCYGTGKAVLEDNE